MQVLPSAILIAFKKSFHWMFLILLTTIFIFVGLYGLNSFTEKHYGAGNIVTYYSSALYGYRPLPNQSITRKSEDTISINNLSIRASSDWDISTSKNKILFLGDSITYGGIHLPNKVLFPELSTKSFKNFMAGNAGVNGWGVLNIKGLIVDAKFTPAQMYVTTLIEADFLRGLVRIGGGPFRMQTPKFGLDEWFFRLLFMLYNISLGNASIQAEDCTVKEIAVENLKLMDSYLKERGYQHLIFISPTRDQVLLNLEVDVSLKHLFELHGLKPIYIVNELNNYNFSEAEKNNIFYDEVHLTVEGHKMWAQIYKNFLELHLKTHA